jgi:hypothetical protein
MNHGAEWYGARDIVARGKEMAMLFEFPLKRGVRE